MTIKLHRAGKGYIALVLRNGLIIAATIKPRQSKQGAVLDGMTLRIAVQS